jgi:hypothetical protein
MVMTSLEVYVEDEIPGSQMSFFSGEGSFFLERWGEILV